MTSKSIPEEWKNVGSKEGLQIWRIEKFAVKEWPAKSFGEFFEDDSFIILWTYKVNNALRYNVHFWLGAKTTQDEAGTAAFKTVELDDLLGDLPIQYREVQGSESNLFLSYFKNGIKYLKGGVDGAFKKGEKEKLEPKLFQLKGRSKVVLSQVDLNGSVLNQGDCLFWMPMIRAGEARVNEKFAGSQFAESLKADRGGKLNIHIVGEEGDDKFWGILGGKPAKIKTAKEGGDDGEIKAKKPCLFHLSDSSGKLSFQKVAEENQFSKSLLNGNDVFILDSGATIYIWIGAKASQDERKSAMKSALDYTKSNNIASNKVSFARVSEGVEPDGFLAFFKK